MAFDEEEYLQLSGLQHFSFCRRQWALIHIEQQWAENLRTVDGRILHEKAHDSSLREKRNDRIITRDMRIHSRELGISGSCDVVEFQQAAEGISLPGQDGLWRPYPVEYKRGWIEIPNATGCAFVSVSHPTRGGWIEISRVDMTCLCCPVPPHMGWVD